MANVCLFLEGTYPYVSGGVSGCVHQLVSMLPRTTFHLVYIGTTSDDLLTLKYRLPANVVGLQEIFLFDDLDPSLRRESELSRRDLSALELFHLELHQGEKGSSPAGPKEIRQALNALFPLHLAGAPLFDSLASRGVWHLLLREYERLGRPIPFVDFFYTWRSAHLPIYRILSQRFPRAEIYHSLCTGYAGLAGAQAAQQNGAPLFITEHGIYSHERAIEIAEADWLMSQHEVQSWADQASDVLKAWWIQMFRNMGRMAYGFASQVITLFDGNQRRQLMDGAPQDRVRVIPNGISLALKGSRRATHSWRGMESGESFRIGFVGRVVPIKDVKTLLKSLCAVVKQYPRIECEIVGPMEEDETYYEECLELMRTLGLSKVVRFVGKKNVEEVYPRLDCLLLTSISEGQPLVVLEANAAGVPVVATRVGACAELLQGREEADRLIGPSGLIANIGDSENIAAKVLSIIRAPSLWERLSLAGIERVTRFYDERELVLRYDLLYREYFGRGQGQSKARLGGLPWQA